jgi:acetyltransferase-like isoleucine patch superfamily enzyme
MENPQKSKLPAWKVWRFNFWLYGLHALSIVVLGLGLFPMISIYYWVWKAMSAHAWWLKIFVFSLSIPFGYFVFGIALIFSAVFIKTILGFKIKPGLYGFYEMGALNWMAYNSMILIVNGAFLDVLRISPFQTLFYRMMGAKVGNNVNVNTSGLADLSMLEIGNNVTIGGGVALICHAAERGLIRLAPTKIGDNVSIGLSSIIMPGCEIGEGAIIAPCSLLPKGTQIPPRSHWGGNPLRDLRAERRAERAG